MRVLLKDGATEATDATILVLSIVAGGMFETLSGERVSEGIVAEVDPKVVVASASSGAKERGTPFVTSKELLIELIWLDKQLADYEEGSTIGTRFSEGTFVLDAFDASQVECAEGLAEGDTIVIAPPIAVKGLINARGQVVAVDDKWVEVEVELGDRNRIKRGSELELGPRVTLTRTCVQKVAV